jgi:hypothetical protein
MRHQVRDSKGRFTRPDTETPDLFSPRVGDVMYYASLGKSQDEPVHYMPVAAEVEEIIDRRGPICRPFKHRPDYPIDLVSFKEAVNRALANNADHECFIMSDLNAAIKDFTGDRKYDFDLPKDITRPKYGIGEHVYVVHISNLVSKQLFPCKGTIIGMVFCYDEVPENRGWKYEIYYKKPASWLDIEHGSKRGTLVEHSTYVKGEMIYRDQAEAVAAIRKFQQEIADKYFYIRQKIKRLQPSFLKPKE